MSGKQTLRRFLHTAAVLCLVLASSSSVADDTEIYFTTGSSSGNTSTPLTPNVLFILDTSGSMAWDAAGTSPTQSRMQVLKEAMTEILSNVEDINLGLMRFTNDDGGPVIFPISFIDSHAEDVVGEAALGDISYSTRISDGNNDAQESTEDSSVTLDDPTLSIAETVETVAGQNTIDLRVNSSNDDAEEDDHGNMSTNGSSLDVEEDNLVAVRFEGIDIPRGADIIDARLVFYVRERRSGKLDVDIRAQIVDNAAAFSSSDDDISDRNFTSGGNDIEWDNVPNPGDNQDVWSPDIDDLVESITDRSGWNPGQAMVFLIRHDDHSGSRSWYSYNSAPDASKRPRLVVTYEAQVAAGSHTNVTALRFESVNIPQGATINSASLSFTPQASDSGTAEWTISAEASDNSPALTATAGDISGRTKTTSTTSAWSVPSATADTAFTTPDSINLLSVVQEIVNRPGWCGGNAITFIIEGTGTRRIKSAEQSASQAPQFSYSYEPSDNTGCYVKQDTAQIATGNDDAEEQSDGDVDLNSGDLDIDGSNDITIGLRFQNVQVPQGATIQNATVKFKSQDGDSGSVTYRITGQAVDDAPAFSTTDNDISSRQRTSQSVTWSIDSWSNNEHGSDTTTPDVSAILNEIFARSGWAPGNSLVLILEKVSGSGNRNADSRETDAADAPLLSMTYQSSGGSEIKTVRERLIELVLDLNARGSTPIVETMLEAAHYWRGEDVDWGLDRDGDEYSRISHAGSYCDGPNDCNGADTTNYPPFGIRNPSGCDPESNPNDSDCDDQEIEGSPKYISPFNSTLTCQQNYQVLLTDGEANSLNSSAIDEIEDMIGKSCASRNLLASGDCGGSGEPPCNYASSEKCGVDLAEFMFKNDHSTLENTQNVKTYTIAFNLTDLGATQFLKDMASKGTGATTPDGNDAFFSASNAADLVSVFTTIIADVKKDPTSFVAPSLATNAFNRLLSRDEVYFGLFTPSLDKRWFGNVKKYNICVDSVGDPDSDSDDCALGEIMDAAGDAAVDSADNKFKETAQSLWSDVVDGRATTLGGTGGEMADYEDRIIYTDAKSDGSVPTSGTELDDSGYQIDIDTWDDPATAHIRTAICPTPSTDPASDCADRMLWLLGKIIEPDDDTDTSTTTRWTVNDVLHSSPAVITYGGTDADSDGVIETFFDKIVVGTNDGGMRVINGSTGIEEFEFLPAATLETQRTLFDNPEGTHPYGLDLTPTVRIKDVNGNGRIEPSAGDRVYVYIGMRRGGRNLYAIDMTGSSQVTSTTQRVIPKFLWRIEGGSGDYARLGDTWSQPRLATIFYNNAPRTVLIFGGGYDDALDNDGDAANGFGTALTGGADNKGNAIFIADADTGDLLLSISGTDSDADIEVADMHYSIPSRITVLDTDGDGVDDRLYVGDTGGQVWRVDLGSQLGVGTPRAGNTVVGKLAAISSTGSGGVNERRFFEPPSVVQVKDEKYADAANSEYDYVLMGTGWRPHPLNKTVHDRFYAFRDRTIGKMVDANQNNIADSYPAGTDPAGSAIGNGDLINVTSQVLDIDEVTHDESLGWYFDFTEAGNPGEKVLSAPITLAGTVLFTTYIPDAAVSTDLCSSQVGGGNAYNLNILNASAVIDWNADTTGVDALADRTLSLGGGIPSDVVPVFTKEGVVGIVGIEGGVAQLGAITGLPRFRTYWYEESGL